MLNILIPMAGLGSRFAKSGFKKPKPFIEVAGKPMITRVMENLQVAGARFILVAQRAHLDKEADLVNEIQQNHCVQFVPIDGLTEGTVCTVLRAQDYIKNTEPLLIANSDQIVDIKMDDFLKDAQERKLDGSILCFRNEARDPKWSFAKTNVEGFVTEVREKKAISELATVGVYYFKSGNIFVNAAKEMIKSGDRVNGEFYTCPVYNFLIQNKLSIGVYIVDQSQMHGLGTPEDLQAFINRAVLK